MDYPEKRPPKVEVERFVFDTRAGKEAAKKLDAEIEELESRIDNIVQRYEVRGIPLIAHVLSITHEKKELMILGKALMRISQLLPELNELQRRRSFIDLATTDPNWLAATFADFSADVDDLEKSLFPDIEHNGDEDLWR